MTMGCGCMKGLGQDPIPLDLAAAWEQLTEFNSDGVRRFKPATMAVLYANMKNESVLDTGASSNLSWLCKAVREGTQTGQPTLAEMVKKQVDSGSVVFGNIALAIPTSEKRVCFQLTGLDSSQLIEYLGQYNALVYPMDASTPGTAPGATSGGMSTGGKIALGLGIVGGVVVVGYLVSKSKRPSFAKNPYFARARARALRSR